MAKRKPKLELETFVLPSSNPDLLAFSKQFKTEMMEHIVSSISYAIQNDLPLIEVFQFKNSDFVITLPKKEFLTNLDNIYTYYLSSEKYELCSRVVALQQTLTKSGVKPSHEKENKRQKVKTKKFNTN
jgi:hypothetical protein